MKKSKAVVFDVDGTLSPEISWLSLTRGLNASVEQHVQIYNNYKYGKANYTDSKKLLIKLWQSTGNANKKFFSQLFNDIPLHPATEKVIKAAKTSKITCLITGSMDLYAEIVAQKLGIKHWYANTILYWDSQEKLIDMDYELNQANKKLEQYTQFCHANNLNLEDCLVLGDDENDESVFAACKHGVLINDSPGSNTYAWKKITQLAEFEQIIRDY